MNQQAAFVTGATGLLGNNLVRTLLDRGFKVRALARVASQGRAAVQWTAGRYGRRKHERRGPVRRIA